MNPNDELLATLRLCAHELLLAYDRTQSMALWVAFEKTTEACLSLDTASFAPTIH